MFNKIQFEQKTIEILGSKMSYTDEGEGDPIVFIHGVPTSKRVWRGIIPGLSQSARCIAVDLIGLGQSGKPDIDYSIDDHVRYFTQFMEALKLENATLVMHAWGSVVGFSYAMHHPHKIKGLAFFESYIRPLTDWTMLSLPMQELAAVVNQEDNADVLANTDFFIEHLLPRALLKDLPDEDIEFYKQVLQKTQRKPLLQYLKELPTGSEPKYIAQLLQEYSDFLRDSSVPKLLIYGVPGYNTTMSTIMWAREHLSNLSMVDIGPMLHFPQISNPDAVGAAIAGWYNPLK